MMKGIRTIIACLSRPYSCCSCGSSGKTQSKNLTDQSAYDATSMHDAVIDVDERKEIARILSYLEDDERVLVVARQSRVLPGATLAFTPNIVFCTARRIIIRNPMMLGLREHIDYYRHRDVKSVRLVRGRFTSSLMLTVPGMGTAARSASGDGDGIITAIPHEKAVAIYRIIQGAGRDGYNGGGGGGSSNNRGNGRHKGGDGSTEAGGNSGSGNRHAGIDSGHGAAKCGWGEETARKEAPVEATATAMMPASGAGA